MASSVRQRSSWWIWSSSASTLWFLTRGERHVQVTDQAAPMCPVEEVPHGPARRGAACQPPVQIGLGKVAQVLAALIQPGQQVEGDQDAGPRSRLIPG